MAETPPAVLLGGVALSLAMTTWVRDHLGRPVGELRAHEDGQDFTAYLSYEDICKLAAQARDVRAQLEWAMATWVSVSMAGSTTYHLARNGEHEGAVPALCGYHPAAPWHWDYTDPIMGEPGSSHTCKRCLSRYSATLVPSAT